MCLAASGSWSFTRRARWTCQGREEVSPWSLQALWEQHCSVRAIFWDTLWKAGSREHPQAVSRDGLQELRSPEKWAGWEYWTKKSFGADSDTKAVWLHTDLEWKPHGVSSCCPGPKKLPKATTQSGVITPEEALWVDACMAHSGEFGGEQIHFPGESCSIPKGREGQWCVTSWCSCSGVQLGPYGPVCSCPHLVAVPKAARPLLFLGWHSAPWEHWDPAGDGFGVLSGLGMCPLAARLYGTFPRGEWLMHKIP